MVIYDYRVIAVYGPPNPESLYDESNNNNNNKANNNWIFFENAFQKYSPSL